MLIGRKDEIRRLKAALENTDAELIAIYGRRRVGKTYLINETYADRIVFRHTALQPLEKHKSEKSSRESEMKRQLEAFYFHMLHAGLKSSKKPKSWLEAFYLFETLLDSIPNLSKNVIFLDEIPWMDTPRAGFLDAFIVFWNNYCAPRHLKVVVCGSASSWILDKIIHNVGGLYKRSTTVIKLNPFTLKECEELFISRGFHYSRYDITRAYMAFGGIPFYFAKFENGFSISQNIDKLLFDEDAMLKDEFEELFSSQFSNVSIHMGIVRFLSKRKMGYSIDDITKSLGVKSGGTLTETLKALENGMFIEPYKPFGEKGKEIYYRLIDPFCIFYLKQVESASSSGKGYWEWHSSSPSAIASRGNAFEIVCYNHIPQIKAKLSIAGYESHESIFYQKGDDGEEGVQIDMIIARKDNVINICEAKFVDGEYRLGKEDHLNLVRRCERVQSIAGEKCSLQPVLITTFGAEDNEYRYDYPHIVTLDDLFQF